VSSPTIAHDSTWSGVLSQHPRLTPCPDCGGYRLPGPHAHSPRWVVVGDVHRQVDCAGRTIREVRP